MCSPESGSGATLVLVLLVSILVPNSTWGRLFNSLIMVHLCLQRKEQVCDALSECARCALKTVCGWQSFVCAQCEKVLCFVLLCFWAQNKSRNRLSCNFLLFRQTFETRNVLATIWRTISALKFKSSAQKFMNLAAKFAAHHCCSLLMFTLRSSFAQDARLADWANWAGLFLSTARRLLSALVVAQWRLSTSADWGTKLDKFESSLTVFAEQLADHLRDKQMGADSSLSFANTDTHRHNHSDDQYRTFSGCSKKLQKIEKSPKISKKQSTGECKVSLKREETTGSSWQVVFALFSLKDARSQARDKLPFCPIWKRWSVAEKCE